MKNNTKMSKKKKILIIVICVVAFFLISNAIATKPIYDGIFGRYDGEPDFDTSAYSQLITAREGFTFTTDNGAMLQAYKYDVAEEKGVVVIAPGLHAGTDDYLPMTESFCEAGYDVIAFDPYGSCKSEGKSSKGFSQEVLDLDCLLDYIEANMDYENVVLFGHSRGGFAVCCMIDEGHNVDAVVSVSGLNSAMEAVIGLSQRYIGPVANANYFNLWAYQVMLFSKGLMDKKADEIIDANKIPTLIVQGSNDTTAPADDFSIYSHKDEISNALVSYILCSDEGSNGHTDLMFDEDAVNEELMSQIVAFYDAVCE